MNDSSSYYLEKLYPFQDGVLKLLGTLKLPFFLTGGTALARGYLGHRYSEDLDFFVNDDPSFLDYVRIFETALLDSSSAHSWRIEQQGVIRSERFVSIPLYYNETLLKIDLVRDIPFRVGTVVEHPTLGLLDTIDNIISNKIGALYRYAEKDVADIWGIWKKFGADWPSVIANAQKKDAGVDAVMAAEIIGSFPSDRFDAIRWSFPVDKLSFMGDLRTIAQELLGLPTGLPPRT